MFSALHSFKQLSYWVRCVERSFELGGSRLKRETHY